ncbi:hypothetical protein HPP92_014205 [Vanilla planifolia]|uniref:Uncharacterized protein n=1 Tax=Vanilla planifolia TaxID=51239 RepID=A0A835USX1_VANPL|nr:hypothetical protein HPP92_014205 [Vanilla planifolia]
MLRGNLKPVTVVLGWQDAVQDYIVHHKSRHPHQQKDPEFYQYLKEHDKELLEFNDEDVNKEMDLWWNPETKPSEIREPDSALDEDVVEDLVLSSEDEEEEARYHGDGDDSRDVDQLRLGKNKRSRKRKKRKISNGNNTKVKEGANSRKKDLRPPSSFAPRVSL